MKLLQQKNYNKDLARALSDSFEITATGLYLLEITASARSWWQNTVTMRSFLKKDSLTVLLDNKLIIPLQKKKLLAEDFWNGNILKGHDQTVYVVMALDVGTHSLSFTVHSGPFLDHMALYRIDNQEIEFKNLKPKKRDRIPWLIFLLNESISISSLAISATTEKQHGNDDNDLRLSLDGTIIKNESAKSHRDWFWCGKILNGTSKKFQKHFDNNASPTRINLDADGTPIIDSLIITVSQKKAQHQLFTIKDVRPYTHKGTNGKENYNRFDQEIVDAVNHWNKEFDDEYPPPEQLHPNLVKAMIYIESRMGYFESNGYPSYPDVMQVADPDNPAIYALNKRRDKNGRLEIEYVWKQGEIVELDYKGKASGESSHESIVWGTRWLYHKAQRG